MDKQLHRVLKLDRHLNKPPSNRILGLENITELQHGHHGPADPTCGGGEHEVNEGCVVNPVDPTGADRRRIDPQLAQPSDRAPAQEAAAELVARFGIAVEQHGLEAALRQGDRSGATRRPGAED